MALKFRSNFVTNSSSSSFIVGFRSEDSVKTSIEEVLKEYGKEYIDLVLSDIAETERLSLEEVVEMISDKEFEDEETRKLWEYQRKNPNKSYRDTIKYFENEGKAELDGIRQKIIAETEQRIKDCGYNIFMSLEYGNDSSKWQQRNERQHWIDSELETIMIDLPITLARLSYH